MSANPKLRALIPLMAAVCMMLAACSSSGGGVPPLEGSKWKVTEISGQAVSETQGVTAEFGADGSLGGKGPCNQYFSSYKQKGSRLTFAMTGSTMMACEDAGVMELEQVYLKDLDRVDSFMIETGSLILLDESGQKLVVLKK